GADIIVGFPGETDEQFEETFTFIQSLPISYLHVFSYSERENTPAAELSRQGHAVSGRIRAERSARLRTLSAEKKQHFYDSCLGEVYTVIPEQYNSLTGLWSGWTENYIRVEFEHEASLPHHPLNVELLHNKGETVFARHTSQPRPQTFVPQRGYIPLLVRQ
ncbi:hypothetical protein HUU42_15710, partial [bacterium]|nr:hypothetical protein [bacterium]